MPGQVGMLENQAGALFRSEPYHHPKLKVKFHLKGNVRQATKWASQEDETKKDSFLNLPPLKRQHTVNLQSHVTPRRPFTIRPVYAGADNMCTVS